MALHEQIAEALGMPVFFCDPHSPWQRPDEREHLLVQDERRRDFFDGR